MQKRDSVDCSLRDATEADRDYLRALHRRCYVDVVSTQFGGWDEELQAHFSDKMWASNRFQIITIDKSDIGALSVKETDEGVVLSEIQIDPAYQRRGIGTGLLRSILARAQSAGASVSLEVLRSNQAIALYKRMGFKEIGCTETHVQMLLCVDRASS